MGEINRREPAAGSEMHLPEPTATLSSPSPVTAPALGPTHHHPVAAPGGSGLALMGYWLGFLQESPSRPWLLSQVITEISLLGILSGVFKMSLHLLFHWPLNVGQAGWQFSLPSHKGQNWGLTRYSTSPTHVPCKQDTGSPNRLLLPRDTQFLCVLAQEIHRVNTYWSGSARQGQNRMHYIFPHSVSFQSPNSGLEKGDSTLSAHLPVKHLSRKNSVCLESASLPPGSLIHPQGLGTCPTCCRELPHPWHCPGFTGPDILCWGSSVHTAEERALSLKPLHSNGRQCRSNARPPQMQDGTQFALKFVVSQMPHKINGPLKIMLI